MLYLDMDGVLSDFSKGCAKYDVSNDSSHIHLPKDQWTAEQATLDSVIKGLMDQDGFFLNLPPMPDLKVLWNFCRPFEPFILTAKPSSDDGYRVVNEKWIWLTEHLGPIKPKQFICCLRSEKKNFIRSSTHRYQILVDDLEANCKDWESVGGIGIVHTSAKATIKELEKYV